MWRGVTDAGSSRALAIPRLGYLHGRREWISKKRLRYLFAMMGATLSEKRDAVGKIFGNEWRYCLKKGFAIIERRKRFVFNGDSKPPAIIEVS